MIIVELEEIKSIISNQFDGYTIKEIRDYDNKYYVFLDKKGEYDIPVLWFDKDSNEKGTIDMIDELSYTVQQKGQPVFEENEGNDMEADKIRNLLSKYGASPEEIENFMTDLYEMKDDIKDDMEDSIEEEDDFNYLDGDTMAKLKATEEGQNLIINAPKMAKDELKKAITEYLSKQS